MEGEASCGLFACYSFSFFLSWRSQLLLHTYLETRLQVFETRRPLNQSWVNGLGASSSSGGRFETARVAATTTLVSAEGLGIESLVLVMFMY